MISAYSIVYIHMYVFRNKMHTFLRNIECYSPSVCHIGYNCIIKSMAEKNYPLWANILVKYRCKKKRFQHNVNLLMRWYNGTMMYCTYTIRMYICISFLLLWRCECVFIFPLCDWKLPDILDKYIYLNDKKVYIILIAFLWKKHFFNVAFFTRVSKKIT